MDSPISAASAQNGEVAPVRQGALELYLAEVSQIPVLNAGEEIALSKQIERASTDFRRELFGVPRAAEEIVATRRQLLREQRSTRRLSAAFGSSGSARREAGERLDHSLERVEVLMKQRERHLEAPVDREALEVIRSRVARALEEANLSLKFVEDVWQRLRPFEGSVERIVRERSRLDEPRRRPRSEAGRRRRRHTLRQLAERRRSLERELGMTTDRFLSAARSMESEWSRLLDARNRFVRHNLKLVVKLARFYAATSSVALVDLIQEGSIGLVRAAEKFDHRRGYKFSTYAVWWIRQAMTRAIQSGSRTIRLPGHVQETLRKYKRVENELEAERGVTPGFDEVLDRTNLPRERAKYVSQIPAEPVSLEAVLPGTNAKTLAEVVADPDATVQAEAADQQRLASLMSQALAPLPDRERRLLCWRYGLAGEREHTLEEIGRKLDLSRERVRQLEVRALDRVKSGPTGEAMQTLVS